MSTAAKPSVQPLSVSQLTTQVRGVVEARFSQVWVVGEVSNFTRASSGHWYFTLKDANAQIKCAMFRGFNLRMKFDPQDGQEIVARGLDVAALEFVLVGKADGVDHEVDRRPARLERIEGHIQRVHVGHVAFDEEIAAEAGGQRQMVQRVAADRAAARGRVDNRRRRRQAPLDRGIAGRHGNASDGSPRRIVRPTRRR